MPIYKYKALTSDKRTISGLVEATSESIAIETLEEKGMSIVNLEEQTKLFSGSFSALQFFNRIKAKDIVIFSRQFSVLISANVTLVQSLKILSEQVENVR